MAQSNFSESYKEDGGWKVFVQRRGWSDIIAVYITERVGSVVSLASINKDGVLVFSVVKDGDEEKPTFMLPSFAWQLLVDAITDTTPPTKKQAVEAELNATRVHLEDMRSLVFDGRKVRGR